MSNFTQSALKLCGQCALLLGWRPAEFWPTTPAELAAVLAALLPQREAPPDPVELRRLMDRFPDTSPANSSPAVGSAANLVVGGDDG